jgi:hypothetical protein
MTVGARSNLGGLAGTVVATAFGFVVILAFAVLRSEFSAREGPLPD